MFSRKKKFFRFSSEQSIAFTSSPTPSPTTFQVFDFVVEALLSRNSNFGSGQEKASFFFCLVIAVIVVGGVGVAGGVIVVGVVGFVGVVGGIGGGDIVVVGNLIIVVLKLRHVP